MKHTSGDIGSHPLAQNLTLGLLFQKRPVKKGVIRGISFLTGYLIRHIDAKSCQLTYVSQSDPKGECWNLASDASSAPHFWNNHWWWLLSHLKKTRHPGKYRYIFEHVFIQALFTWNTLHCGYKDNSMLQYMCI